MLLDISAVFDVKRKAMECLGAQRHLWQYYTELARRRGNHLSRNSGPNMGLPADVMAEAYMRPFPQVTEALA